MTFFWTLLLPFIELNPYYFNYQTLIYGTLRFKISWEVLAHILKLCGSMCYNQELGKRFVKGIKGACFVHSRSLFKMTELQKRLPYVGLISIDVQVLNDETD